MDFKQYTDLLQKIKKQDKVIEVLKQQRLQAFLKGCMKHDNPNRFETFNKIEKIFDLEIGTL